MNPLDWSGEQFLSAYVPFVVVLLLLAKVWQSSLNQPSDEPLRAELKLDPYHVAALQHRESAVRAAVTALVHAGAVRVENGALEAVGKLPAGVVPFERAVHVAVAGPVRDVAALNGAVARELDELEVGLRRRGFLMNPEVASRCGTYPKLLFFGAALGLGVLKLGMGISRGRPVGFLVVLLCIATVMGFWLLGGAPRRTRKGDKALAKLRADNEALRTTAKADGAWGTMSSGSVAMAVALFGTGLLAASGMGDLRDYLMPPGSGGGGVDTDFGGDSGGSDSGGGDSGGGDGGSSCGGGGCGGCGGGGGD
ncbi:TIGR04222 domain-containing membrane protein [Archangium gephyra]|uniref:TIGR04222 domain-containing membrane protein n=1 Tax=Archangium gephyra TaxID=48 RepID=UPI0035D3DF65